MNGNCCGVGSFFYSSNELSLVVVHWENESIQWLWFQGGSNFFLSSRCLDHSFSFSFPMKHCSLVMWNPRMNMHHLLPCSPWKGTEWPWHYFSKTPELGTFKWVVFKVVYCWWCRCSLRNQKPLFTSDVLHWCIIGTQ